MNVTELLAKLTEEDLVLYVSEGELHVTGNKQKLSDANLLALLRENKQALIDTIERRGAFSSINGTVLVPPNGIPADCGRIVPEMVPLVKLSEEEIERVVSGVGGGVKNVQDIYPLAPLQEGILFHHLMVKVGDPYVLRSLFSFDTRERLDRYMRAVQAVIDRHDILRTGVLWEGLSEAVQVVWRRASLSVQEVEMVEGDGEVAEQLWDRFDQRKYRLDIGRAPMMRVFIARDVRRGRWLAMGLVHHMCADHVTQELMRGEVQAHLLGEEKGLLGPQPFRDFVAQARWGVSREEQESFFRGMLGDVREPTEPFGLGNVRGDGRGVVEARQEVEIGLSRRLRERARGLGVSVASIVHLAWGQVLARACGREEVVFGTVLLGRMQAGAGADRALGLFMNTLPLRVNVGGESVQESVMRTHGMLTQLLRHEHASLALAQRSSQVSAPAPLFTALLNYRHSSQSVVGSEEVSGVWQGVEHLRGEERTNYPLVMSVDDLGEEGYGLTVHVEDSVDAGCVCRMMNQALQGTVQALEMSPSKSVRLVDVLSAEECKELRRFGQGQRCQYPQEKCLHELLEEQAERRANEVAVSCGERHLTYAELNARANRLAHHLKGLGVGPETRVAVCLERGVELVVGIWAILKAGGAYVPLDPGHPVGRLLEVVQDSESKVLLLDERVSEPKSRELREWAMRSGSAVVQIQKDAEAWDKQSDTNPVRGEVKPEHLAYVIYTSGSTGRPKGVMVEHRNVVSLLYAMKQEVEVARGDVWLAVTTIAFDIASLELHLPLLVGARLKISEEGMSQDPARLQQALAQEVTIMQATPSTWGMLLQGGWGGKAGLKALCGGEALRSELASALNERVGRLWNVYGPTETTIWSSLERIEGSKQEAGKVWSIGRPIGNTSMSILDGAGQPVPMGVRGEIHIGGAGVARGYLNRAELTAERFVPDPYSERAGARMYRTGDMGRYRVDGAIEFMGRNDQQVKVRGYRVELGEIEARLREHAGVGEAVVLAREDGAGDKRLVAYYTERGDPASVGAETLRGHLSSTLPEYMVPAAYVSLEAMPLTPNGKLDRKALPAPDEGAYGSRSDEPPEGEVEQVLAGIWSEVLKQERIGRRDNFFELGGHSLLAMSLISRVRQRLGVELGLSEVFEQPQLVELAQRVKKAARTRLPAITASARQQGLIPVSYAQQRLWFLSQMPGVSEAYHVPMGLRLRGRLDREALRRALERVVQRHEVLRTRFVQREGQPWQQVGSEGLEWSEHDLVGEPSASERLERIKEQEVRAPFDLSAGGLVRARLVQLGEQEHVLLLTMHHIVSDGWSMGILSKELGALYGAYASGREDPLSALAIQYGDYAAWQRRWMGQEVLQKQSEYWQKELSGAPAVLELPTDHERPAQQSHAGAWLGLELDEELSGALKQLSQRHGTTLFMTLLAGFAAVLSRLSGQTDIVIGTPVANRTRREVEPLIGFFVNTLALRLDLSVGETVRGLLEQVKARALSAQDHQDMPFEQVVEMVKPARSLSHTPLFQVMFAWQNEQDEPVELGGVTVSAEPMPYEVSKFDLTLNLMESGGRIVGGLEYARALFDRTTVERYIGYLKRAWWSMVRDDQQRLETLTLMSEGERRQLLVEWNATQADYPQDQCVHQLFEVQARERPEAPAVIEEDRQLSYGELNARANRLAHYLRRLDIGPDDRVAICIERSVQMVVGVLAVLKAGGAYVPLDPSYPVERLKYMLGDSRPKVILTTAGANEAAQHELDSTLKELGIRALDLVHDASAWEHEAPVNPDPASVGLGPAHLAYVIYTSGSTGRPKGVMIEHRSLTSQMVALSNEYGIGFDDCVLQVASITFDVAVEEVLGSLCWGARLVLRDDSWLSDSKRFWDRCAASGVTLLNLPTLLWETLVEDAGVALPARLRAIITGGEALSSRAKEGWFNRPGHRPRLFNAYGPTETTINATVGHLSTTNQNWQCIGRPFTNTRVYILDAHRSPVLRGVTGELYIGGTGVARCYRNRPELTAEKFVPDPYSAVAGARMYRTGDFGRQRADSTIEFLGRLDFQIKLRGFRVELGEVEARLREHAAVREAVVVAREDIPGNRRLVAYYTERSVDAEAATTSADCRLSSEALLAHMSSRLPGYMVPGLYMRLLAMPLTPSGKIDRSALPTPDPAGHDRSGYEQPVDEMETVLAEIWAEMLTVERIGRRDNFFELGGHSLLAMSLISRVRQRLGVELGLSEVFEQPQLVELAQRVKKAARTRLPAITASARQQGLIPVSYAQQRLWFLSQMPGVSEAYHVPMGLRLRGRLDREALRRALERVVQRHEVLRTRFVQREGQPWQQVGSEGLEWSEHDLVGEPSASERLERIKEQEVRAPFDLSAGGLVRARLVQLGEQEHVLLLTMHHIVSDGWSMGILSKELGALYGAYASGREDPLSALAIQYGDYAAWQRRWMGQEVLQKQSEYWQKELSGAPAVLELPTDHERPAQQSHAGAWLGLELDEELSGALKQLSQRHGTTLFMTLLAGFAAVLSRLSGQTDIVIGTPVANRTRREVEPLIGFFVNTLALRLDLSVGETVRGLLEQVKARALSAQDHQDMPFEQVVEMVKPARSLSHTPLFQVMFAWQNEQDEPVELGGVTVSAEPMPYEVSKFDLTLNLMESGGRIVGGLEYARALFDRTTVERYIGYLKRAWWSMVRDDQQRLETLTLMSEGERRQLLVEWNATQADYPQDQCVHQLFEVQARERPEAPAVIEEDRQLSYGELNARANRLAHYLRRLDIGPDDRVAICIERSVQMVVGVLAVLKAGGAYVPLDPSYPVERLKYMLGDSRPKVILTTAGANEAAQHELDSTLKELGIRALDLVHDASAWEHEAPVNPDPASVGLGPAHLAYVIYTSGSTGRPKGVMVEHRGLCNVAAAQIRSFGVTPNSRVLQFASPSFDACAWELTMALCGGCSLHLPARGTARFGATLVNTIEHHRVTHATLPPAVLEGLGDRADLRSVQVLIVAGEATSARLAARWAPQRRLINAYGPTETSICATVHTCSLNSSGAPPIGRPIANTYVYILDPYGQPVPIGVEGEIYIAGAGVARGYLEQPQLTAERFVPNPFVGTPGARMYRTGDLGRFVQDGTIEFRGRNDFQVKIRGHRIELGEIEARLREHAGVQDAVVLTRNDEHDTRLIAYYTRRHHNAVPDDGSAAETGAAALRAHLSSVLPEYMVPAAYVALESMPLTPNGKLDRKALPTPENSAYVTRSYEPPVGDVEHRLAVLWAEVLKVECVGRHDQFFELGGHSLSAVNLVERMRKEGMHVDVRAIFGKPTVAALAASLAESRVVMRAPSYRLEPHIDRIVPEMVPLVKLSEEEIERVVSGVGGGVKNVQDIYPLAPLQEGILFHHLMVKVGDPYVLRSLFSFDTRERLDRYMRAVQAVIDRHDILRTGVLWEGLSEAVQVVWRRASLSVQEVEMVEGDGEVAEQLWDRFDQRKYRLDIGRAPMMRVFIARDVRRGRWLAMGLVHHMCADHVTQELMRGEVQAHLLGEEKGLLGPQPFRDFVAQARWGVSREEQESFFRGMLGDVREPTEPFGLGNVRGDGRGVVEARQEVEIGLSRRLRERARGLGVSVASIVHLAWGQVLARACGREEVVFGTVLLGRMQAGAGADRALGLFMNTLPLRVNVGGESVQESVMRTHGMLTQLLRHEHASLALAQRSSQVSAPAPLFTALLNYRHSSQSVVGSEEVSGVWQGVEHLRGEERTNYPLVMSVDDLGEEGYGLTVHVEDSVDAGCVCRMMNQALQGTVQALEMSPSKSVRLVDVLSAEECKELRRFGQGQRCQYPQEKCLHELLEEQAERRANEVAVSCGERHLTYAELNARANRLAHHLKGLGVGPETRVAVCLERGVELVVGIWAILKAGGAYVPLDPGHPVGRLLEVVQDSESKVLLLDERVSEPKSRELREWAMRSGSAVVQIQKDAEAWDKQSDTNPVRGEVKPEHLAYVIYTSGSTGRPKGVMVEHRNVVSLLYAMKQEVEVARGDVWLAVTTIAFDIASLELHLPLLVGARLKISEEGMSQDPARLQQALAQEVTIMQATPSTWGMLLQGGWGGKAGLKALCGGEALRSELASALNERVGRLWNVYGPTETTIWSSLERIEGSKQEAGKVWSIGRPIGNTSMSILDGAGQPVPMGVRGEIHIGGAGVARGYLNRAELTAERFVPDPYSERAGARMYRTGDMGRYRVDGAIEFMGRNDQQVKVRGYRVELGEIEARLREHAGVGEAVVLAREDGAGDKRLVAYYTERGDPASVGAETLRGHLSSTLPEYMVPAAYVSLEAMPLTPNGKLDRKALPAPDEGAYGSRSDEPPEGEVEQVLAGIWSEVLKQERIGRRDNFFELGGHSLLAMSLISRVRQRLGVELGLSEVFEQPQLVELAQRVKKAARTRLPAITASARQQGLIPVSYAQQRLWFLSQMPGVSEAYHVPMGLRLRGRLDREALRRALERVVQRHEVLRTRFVQREGQPWQQVGSEGLEWSEHDLVGEPSASERLERIKEQEVRAPFDLSAGGLVRARLVQLGEQEHVLLLTMHHIVSDGWSMGILSKELGALYGAYASGREDPLSALAIQYGDYAAWQRRWMGQEVLQKQSEYWQKELSGAPAVLELPTDHERPAQQSHAGAWLGLELDEELSGALKQLSQRHGTTLFMTLLAGFAAVLSRLSGQTDIVIGTPVANRTRREVEPLIGFFVNTLALRLDLSVGETVRGLLEQVKARALSAQDHQDMPFEQVVEMVKPARSLSHTPLFQVMFAWQNEQDEPVELGGVTVSAEPMPYEVSKFDLTLNLMESGGRIVGGLEYARALFDRTTVERYIGYLKRAWWSMVRDDQQRLETLTLMSEGERRQLLVEWNATQADYPQDQCVHQLFEVQARERPEAPAVIEEDRQLSYGELNARANRLAHYLRRLDIGPDDRVAICIERSVQMVVGVLAVLKAGGAYVPLDPSYPVERLSDMLQDARPEVVLTGGAVASPVRREIERALASKGGERVLDVEADAGRWQGESTSNPDQKGIGLSEEHVAYVIYTSGSTGKPKGVMSHHRGVVNRLRWMQQAYGLKSDDAVLQKTPLSFDVSVWEIFWPLQQGARLVVARAGGHREPTYLSEVIEREKVTTVHFVPSMLGKFLEQGETSRWGSLRRVICSGEELTPSLVQGFWQRRGEAKLYNLYGPTEASIDVTSWECSEETSGAQSVPIGRPVSNTRMYILDDRGRPVPMGVVGELHIGGVQVARGYLNRAELTAERFVPDPYSERAGARMYRTGDMGRYRADGAIEFMGRNDQQVKVRGYRVELGEIEARLREHAGVGEAVVLAREDSAGDKRLVAYYTERGDPASVGAETLRGHLSSTLPEYMVPAAYVSLEAMPLTPNGKLDRKALPAPDEGAYGSRSDEPPEGEVEQALAGIWSEVLKQERIGRRDNFFELGGHSLLAVDAMNLARRVGLDISLPDIFSHPTIKDLAWYLGQTQREGHKVVEVRPRGLGPPLFLVHEFHGLNLYFPLLAAHVDATIPVYGLPGVPLGEPQPPTMDDLVGRLIRMIQTVQRTGPYRLAGWSFGGVICYEMARQLGVRGESVEFLGILDARCPTGLTPNEAIDYTPNRALFDLCAQKSVNCRDLSSPDKESKPSDHTLHELERRIDEMDFHELLRRLRQAGLEVPVHLVGATPEVIQLYCGRLVAHHRMLMNYRVIPIPVTMHLFVARDRSRGTESMEHLLGWDKVLADTQIRAIEIPGNHTSIMEQPHIVELGQVLSKAIREAIQPGVPPNVSMSVRQSNS